jgi:hypothetical protein
MTRYDVMREVPAGFPESSGSSFLSKNRLQVSAINIALRFVVTLVNPSPGR